MFAVLVLLISFTIAASVVDFPDPVGPVTIPNLYAYLLYHKDLRKTKLFHVWYFTFYSSTNTYGSINCFTKFAPNLKPLRAIAGLTHVFFQIFPILLHYSSLKANLLYLAL